MRAQFRRLRRRLEAMDTALAHVFRFHYQLDQCVADPELCIVRQCVPLDKCVGLYPVTHPVFLFRALKVHDALSQLFSGA